MRTSRAVASRVAEFSLALVCGAIASPVAADDHCNPRQDRTTGGGWLVPANGERTFGFVGALRDGADASGRLEFANHGMKDSLKGRITTYIVEPGNARTMIGEGIADGEAAEFELRVVDTGGSGSADVFDLSYQTATMNRTESGTVYEGEIRIHPGCP